MDDDYMDDEDYGLQYSDDSETEPDVDLENEYYTAKAQKAEGNLNEAKNGLLKVLTLEQEKGEWGFKALKQLCKMAFAQNNYTDMLTHYTRLLDYIRSAVTKNYSEKSINGILDYISTSKQLPLLQKFYEVTLDSLRDAKNDRLWFKTNTKLGKLYFEMGDYDKLANIIQQLRVACQKDGSAEDEKKATQLLEVCALEIQMYTEQKNNKALKALYEQSLRVQSGMTHPLNNAIIRECGGKMHLREGAYERAHIDFFDAFKSYDEAGSPRRSLCLKYLVLANMLCKSDINPFDSQEAKSFKNDADVVAMTELVEAYQEHSLDAFEAVLDKHREALFSDPFIKEHVEQLLSNVRSKVLTRLLRPYRSVSKAWLAQSLHIANDELKRLLVAGIHDGAFDVLIDDTAQLVVRHPRPSNTDTLGQRTDAQSQQQQDVKKNAADPSSGGISKLTRSQPTHQNLPHAPVVDYEALTTLVGEVTTLTLSLGQLAR